ncbi:DUF4345 domain-containing protein [Curtobacterium sp. S6]|uniref:DUF4345 domain-containing protein n=1 Tax=Curtobacterium sp. S6 TaxID=1479623 RepID=UPI00069146BA|nr:DUF4345 domain-containing protein [Curtobacterium sp. S6]
MTTPPTPDNGGTPGPRSDGPWAGRAAESAPSNAQPTDRVAGPGRAERPRAGEPAGHAAGDAASGRSSRGTTTKNSQKSSRPGQAKQQDWGLFRTVVALYGLAIIAYGVWQIVAGTTALPGETERPSATVAGSYGAMAAVLCGVGAAFVAIAIKFKWANVLWFVCLMIFMGGIGRILAWAIFGLPNALMIVLMVLDLVIPPCLLVWHAWVTKANRIRRDMTQGASPSAEAQRGKKRARRS